MNQKPQRRLAAIMAADVVGYSRLIGSDELGTIAAVRSLQHDLLQPVLEDFRGRLVKTMGDGFLIEFSSVVDGVDAAVAIQTRLGQAAGPIALRIGIHVGDVVIEGADILGDGVNVAARIEPLAQTGGIGISDEAYRHVRGRSGTDWADGGTHELKNIARPVRVWHWLPQSGGADAPPPPAAKDAALPLPDKPSVAVLPFDNMSGDPEQEFFADGMTEDLITDLSKVSGLFVVARNSTFAYKGKAVDIPDFARRMGVRNVIEGSVRKAGQRVRINVQLIDAVSGGHVWAERYDGMLDEVFELQDEVCARVVEALSVQLTGREENLIGQVHTRNVDAYELYVQAKAAPYPPVPERIARALGMFEQVVEMAPEFAGGYAGMSWLVSFGAIWSNQDPEPLGVKAEQLARRAISADPTFGWAHTALGLSYLVQRRFDEAQAAAAEALTLVPNDADAHAFQCLILGFVNRRLEALAAVDRALRLSPHFINGPYLNLQSQTRFLIGDYRGSVQSHEANIARSGPLGPPAYCWSAASYHALGEEATAARIVGELKSRFPQFQLSRMNYLKLFPTDAERDRVWKLMADAGLPT